MNLYSDVELLEDQISLLKSEIDRKEASIMIKKHVESAAKELSLDRFSTFESALLQVNLCSKYFFN